MVAHDRVNDGVDAKKAVINRRFQGNGRECRPPRKRHFTSNCRPMAAFNAQFFKQALIGSRKLAVEQFLATHPAQVRATNRARFGINETTAKKTQIDALFGILVSDYLDQIQYLHADIQLFLQFPAKTLFKRFFRLALAARKFPQAAQVIALATLRDQKQPFAKNKSSGDVNGGHGTDRRKRR